MNQHYRSLRRPVTSIATYVVCAFLLAGAIKFLSHDAFPYLADYTEETFARYWPNRGWLLVHIAGGAVGLLAGPFQLWSGFRRSSPQAHRWTGYAYIVGIALAASASFQLSFHTVPAFGTALFVLAIMWWITIIMAYTAIRNSRIAAHREWMIRSYIVTFSFVTYRFIVPVSAFNELGENKYATALWISWVVPLMLAEVILHWKRVSKR